MKGFVLSVKVETGVYRHLVVRESMSLEELSQMILWAFDFDNDHMHAFFMNNHAWQASEQYAQRTPFDDEVDSVGYTDEYKLSDFDLEKGKKFLMVFDFGDDWHFEISVLKKLDEGKIVEGILKSVGEVEQYPDYDEDEDEDED